MARYRKRDAFEERVADEIEADGHRFTVDLIAKRATGVEGYRMTLVFLELGDSTSYFVELDPAESREAAERRVESLRTDEAELLRLLARQMSEPASEG